MLDKEFQYYLDNQNKLVKLYNGKQLVIKDQAVQGDFNTIEEAYDFAISKFELGTFLIQECSEGENGYTQTFHSRVIFA